MKVTVTAPSRLHLGLAGLGTAGARCFGGVGLAISHYVTTVTVERQPGSEGVTIVASRELQDVLASLVRDTCGYGLKITVCRTPPRHCGFGTGTALRLAVLEGVARATDREIGDEELRARSGRGGASGVGINTYFLGGLIGDGGHRRTAETEIVPSGSRKGGGWPAPKPIWRKDWPEKWQVAVCHPENYRRISGAEEERFVRSSFPIPNEEVDALVRELFFELPASIDDLDFAGFRSCLEQSRSLGFKKREIDFRGETHDALARLAEVKELAFTMSSVGPSIVIFHDDALRVQNIIDILPSRWLLIEGVAVNSGRSLSVEA